MKKFFRMIKQLVVLVVFFVALLAGAWFASENPERFSPRFFGYALPELSVGIYLCFAIILGIVVGGSLNVLGAWLKLLKVKQQKNREIKKLRTNIEYGKN